MNQKQTYRHEVGGGYLWSPKRRANQTRNRFYENMRVVAPGDLVFSYWDTAIRAYGWLRSFGYDAPKPNEFGSVGRNWSQIGYRADVEYTLLDTAIYPREVALWNRIRQLLPSRYSPLHHATGKNLQSVYLAELPTALGQALWDALVAVGNRFEVRDSQRALHTSLEELEREEWERHLLMELRAAPFASTERDAVIRARRGQGRFRANVAAIERQCRITHVSNPAYLIASHIKPWRHAANDERIDGHNGLMMAPQADFLFDRGFISFGDGRLLISPVADEKSLVKLGVDPERPPEVGQFTDAQERFLEFHRSEVFRCANAK